MKSFFKKLAFVMAMAMVVSLAAPAAANAATVLFAALQGTTAKVENLEMTLGEEAVDLCFINAPKGWRSLERGWKVTKGDAVTVDQNGVITAVKAGDATVEFFMAGCESAVVNVKVVEPVTEKFEGYTQTSVKTVVLSFNESVAGVKEADVELYRLFDSIDGPVSVFWPIDGYSVKDNTMTISPFVNYGDGENYKVVFGGEEYFFTTVVPEIEEVDYVVTTFGTNSAANDGKASVSDEETGVEVVVNLGYKLMYGQMDVTALFKDEVSVEYQLVSPDPEGDSEELDNILFDSEGSIIFAADVPVYVKAVVTYETEEGDAEIPSPGIGIDPEALPAYKFDRVVDFAFYQSGDFSWSKKTIPAGDAGYQLVLRVVDTYGDYYVTHAKAVNVIKGDALLDGSRLEEAGYWFQYYSTNTDTFLLDESSENLEVPGIVTYKQATNAVFYVALHQEVEDKEETFVDNVYAAAFNIGAPRAFDWIHLNKTNISIMADAETTDLTTANVVITAKDNYDATWVYNAEEGGVDPVYEVTCSDDDAKEGFNYVASEKKVYLDGTVLYEETGKTLLTFTVKEVATGKTAKFTVSLGKPNWKDRSIEYTKENFVVGQLAANKNEWVNVDGKDWQKYTILVDQSNGYDKIKFDASTAYLGFINNVDSTNNFYKQATVTLYKTSSSQKIGYHDVTGYTIVTDAKWNEATGYTEGQRLVALLKDGKIVKPADNGIYTITTAANGKINVQLTADEGEKGMAYAKEGTYTLAVYTVTDITSAGKAKYVTDDVDFKVSDNRTHVALDERIAITTAETTADASTLGEIVVDGFSFKLGGKAWKCDASVIKSVTYKTDGKYVIVRDVTFMIPVDGSTSLSGGEDYYIEKVTGINMSVELAQ